MTMRQASSRSWFHHCRMVWPLSAVLVAGAIAAGGALGQTTPDQRAVCPAAGPHHAQRNPWRPARHQLAPLGAGMINLCRYGGLNSNPRFKLVGNDLVADQATRNRLISRFDALKHYPRRKPGQPPLRCPADSGEEVLATLFYPHGHTVTIVVHTQGCADASNGDLTRAAFNSHAGRRLIPQLNHLTDLRQTYHSFN